MWLIVLAMNQEKTTVPIDAYPLSFVYGQKKHYDINSPQIIHVMFVWYFVSEENFAVIIIFSFLREFNTAKVAKIWTGKH